MRTLFVVSGMALAALFTNASAVAESATGIICQPKTNTDAGRIRYSGNAILNASTTNSAVVNCNMGPSGFPRVVVRDATTFANITCTGYYLASAGILTNAGNRSSTGTGHSFLDWTPVGIGEYWSAQCTLPAATGAAESQMSAIESVE